MGGEIILVFGSFIGFFAFLRLLYLSVDHETRPNGLSTLFFSMLAGVWFSWGDRLANIPTSFFLGFLLGSIVFGLHANILIWLQSKYQSNK